MTRKASQRHNSNNATVAAVQQSQLASLQGAKTLQKPSTPAQKTAQAPLQAKSSSKPATPAPANAPASFAATLAKPIQAGNSKVNSASAAKPQLLASKPSTPAPANAPAGFATALARPVQAANSKASGAVTAKPQMIANHNKPQPVRRFDLGPGYEMHMLPAMFADPMAWTKSCSPAAPPHRAAKLTQNAQRQATQPAASRTPQKFNAPGYEVNMLPSLFMEPPQWASCCRPADPPHRAQAKAKPATPQPAGNARKSGKVHSKPAVSVASKSKNAVKWNSPAGKQLIVRPSGALVLYQPLWLQLNIWSIEQKNNIQRQQRGRSADKPSRMQRMQEAKARAQEEARRSHADYRSPFPQPKQQPNTNKPMARQASSASQKTPASMSRQASNASWMSRQNSGASWTSVNKSNSSPVDWKKNVWEEFYSPKPQPAAPHANTHQKQQQQQQQRPKNATQRQQQNAARTNGGSLKPTIPPPAQAKSPEIFSFVKHGAPLPQPSPIPNHANNFNKSKSASSPTGNTPDWFADYFDGSAAANSAAKSPSQKYAEMRAAKPKHAPYMAPNNSMPREMINHSSEGSNWVDMKLENDAWERGIQLQRNKPKPLARQNSSFIAWLSPAGVAVASAIVAIGSVGFSKLLG
ncbi:hypothetical protein HDU84_004951 [Entophlyctis sp. JEL0112]|nr:hypothetical protein HDU84_004951 [Entophlyctis sp. JEL0112]